MTLSFFSCCGPDRHAFDHGPDQRSSAALRARPATAEQPSGFLSSRFREALPQNTTLKWAGPSPLWYKFSQKSDFERYLEEQSCKRKEVIDSSGSGSGGEIWGIKVQLAQRSFVLKPRLVFFFFFQRTSMKKTAGLRCHTDPRRMMSTLGSCCHPTGLVFPLSDDQF